MKTLLVIAFLLPTMLFAQQTYVPDDNFEQRLIDLGLDEGALDDFVPTTNIDTIKYLDVSRYGIHDLSGIEGFIALEAFVCTSNQLTTLDLSNNKNLVVLFCNSNQISNLYISNSINLSELHCDANLLTSLDVSNNIYLKIIACAHNQITNIDVSNCKELIRFGPSYNRLTTLDLSNNLELTSINCSYNNLSKLDMSQNTKLVDIQCGDNCSYNNIVNLDLKNNYLIKGINCQYNFLETLDLRTGTYKMIERMNSENNENLLCIQVSDLEWSNNNPEWKKDDHAVYSEDCGYTSVLDNSVPTFTISPNPATDFINIESESLNTEIELYNMLGISVLKATANEQIDVSGLPRGVYFIKIDENTYSKLILH